ncbi:MAG: hypothetical protein QMC07_09370 [Flavobacteriaceae bacterium]|jgi:hypothetical protein
MNILKMLRKPYLSLFLSALILFVSCEQNDLNNEQNNREINLHSFETLKGQLMDINKLNVNNSKTEFNSRLDQNNHLLSEVNSYYGTEIDFDDNLKSINTEEEIINWLKINTPFDENDIDNLKNFSSNLTSLGLEESVSTLENEISNEDMDLYKFEKYQSIVNGIALIEYQYPGYFTSENSQGLASRSCGWALFKLGLASAALVAGCSPPAAGASVGASCYIAATSFIAASASVGMECGDN